MLNSERIYYMKYNMPRFNFQTLINFGCVNILAAFPYRDGFYPDGPLVNTHSTPLECGNFGISFL
ncbi:hypothetical protein F4Y93_13050 [Candidatus Poribacteria bacterium]|nr:hypothetical protein [Candidatus Poribacteria bacterium]